MNQTNKSRINKTEYSFNKSAIGTMSWLKNNQFHRERDLPATIHTNGDMFWYRNGNFHRKNDLPATIYNDGRLCWYENGRLMDTNW